MSLAIIIAAYAMISFFVMNPKETEGVLWRIENSTTIDELKKQINDTKCVAMNFENPRSETDKNFPDLKSLKLSIKISATDRIEHNTKFKFYEDSSGKLFVYYYDRKGAIGPKPQDYINSEIDAVRALLSDCLAIHVKEPKRINLD